MSDSDLHPGSLASLEARVSSAGRPRVGVIGAGPAGLTAAYELSGKGATVDLYEAGPAPGGLCRTFELWNQRVDLGPHRFFSNDARVNRLWLDAIGSDYQMVDRLTRIFYANKFFYYPLKAGNALRNLGLVEACRCMASYGQQKLNPLPSADTFENWVVRAFGRRLFEIFFKTYSEKLWGIPCDELDADFAAQRIKKLSLFEAVKHALLGGGGGHKTLVDRFAYPTLGTGAVYEKMASRIQRDGNRVLYRKPVDRVLVENGRAVGLRLAGGSVEKYDYVISTMPLTLLVDRLPDVPANVRSHLSKLRYRNTILVYLKAEGQELFPDNWLYVHSDNLRTGRITNFRNWSPALYGDDPHTILALEYWCNTEDPLWAAGHDEIIALAKSELAQTGLAGRAPVTDGHVHRIERCYPVYARGYKDHLKPVEAYVSSVPGLFAIGRYGAFKYNNQDHSILMGLLAAQSILDKPSQDLWSVNTDYESYQESSVITEEGLVSLAR